MKADSGLLFEKESYAITGAAIDVHRQLGAGFAEGVYQEALAVELSSRGIPFKAEQIIPVFYKGVPLRKTYRADFVCFGKIIVELKAISKLTSKDEQQILNYLKATRMQLALLFNFGSFGKLERRRKVMNDPKYVPAVIDTMDGVKNYWRK